MDTLKKVAHTLAYTELVTILRNKKKVTAFGVQKNERAVLCSALDGFTLFVTADFVSAKETVRLLNALNDGEYVFIPHREDVLLYKSSLGKSFVEQLSDTLYSLSQKRGAVCCVEALLEPFVHKETFFNSILNFKQNCDYSVTDTAKALVNAGYSRESVIGAIGDFAIRGDILDIFLSEEKQVRINFFGDTVESIYTLKDNQNCETLNEITVLPLFESTPCDSSLIDSIEVLLKKSKASADAKARCDVILSELRAQSANGILCSSWLYPFIQSSPLKEYLPENTTVVWDEPNELLRKIDFDYSEHALRMENLLNFGEVLPMHDNALYGRYSAMEHYKDFDALALQSMNYQTEFFKPKELVSFSSSAVQNYRTDFAKLCNDIRQWKQFDYQVMICLGDSKNFELFDAHLKENEIYAVAEGVLTQNRADALLVDVFLPHGFISHTNKLAVIGTREIVGESKVNVSKTNKQVFMSIEQGDYVVHNFHGIGRCLGIQRITNSSGQEKDYFVIQYKNGTVAVPVENSNTLSRYFGGEKPTLSKLGGEDFARTVKKVKKSVKEMSFDLVKLYAEREKPRGFVYKLDSYLDEEFSSTFTWTETEDQHKCVAEIDADLKKDRIMDRVLVGDVGYGKTEVALRTAFKVVANKKQVALLCPTTILAEQHYNTFKERMSWFDIKVACLNRFRTKQEQSRILKQLAEGKIDILIGTHRLLSKDVHFKELSLLILDEEQRFGVEHKEKLKNLKASVDVLTLSATPIPRTLHMALTGIRDISTITTPPKERIPIQTFVVEDSDAIIRDVISREINRGGQVFFVYNSVETIDRFHEHLLSVIPEAKIVVAHGQMDERILEDAVYSFVSQKSNVLLCSTIIENGIDMPNANTLIVYDADKLGLSQLYQLRGRVGRSNKMAYAYFVYGQDKVLSSTAYKRLSSIMEYSELGSGFKIALKDLEIRGAGNVLGREQHGHMVEVGYDMYVRLLNESMAEVQGKKNEQSITDCTVDIDLDSYAPADYIYTVEERMDFYQTLAGCQTDEDAEKLHKSLCETYGAPPKQVENLFCVAKMRNYAERAGINKLVFKNGKVSMYYAEKERFVSQKVFEALSQYASVLEASSVEMMLTVNTSTFIQKERELDLVVRILQSLIQ